MATPEFELRISTQGNLHVTRDVLALALAHGSNAHLFANMHCKIGLGRVWSERTYEHDIKAFRVSTYFTVPTEEQAKRMDDARLLVSVLLHPGCISTQAVCIAKPNQPPAIRETWRKVGHCLEDLDYASTQLANLGAELNPESGMFNLPERIRDVSEFPAFDQTIQHALSTETLPPNLASLLSQKFVDLAQLRKEVKDLNLVRLKAVHTLRRAQALDGLCFCIPVFDPPASAAKWHGPDFQRVVTLDD
jgi:hypothetical protein